MVTPETLHTLEQIVQELRIASDEVNRPQEHVVTMSVCHAAQHALRKMMELYLETQGSQPQSSLNLEELYQLCLAHNGAFRMADVSAIDCRTTDEKDRYCLSIDHVNCCRNVANEMASVLSRELYMGAGD